MSAILDLATNAAFRVLACIPARSEPLLPLECTSRVLIIRLDGIGDYVLFTAFLRELRHALSTSAKICLVTTPEVLALARHNPHVDDVVSVRFGIGKLDHQSGVLDAAGQVWEFLRCRRALRSFQPELAIVPRWDVDSFHPSLLAWLSGAPRRVGFGKRTSSGSVPQHQGSKTLLSLLVPPTGPPQHEVVKSLSLLTVLGATPRSSHLEINICHEDDDWATALLAENSPARLAPLIALGIGARHAKRRWPVEHFVKLGRWLVESHGAHLVVVGGVDDVLPAAEIKSRLGQNHVLAITGAASLGQTAALLKRCSLFVGNDSAPMHLAAAVDVPVIELSCHPKTGDDFHPNSPIRFGPWGVAHMVLCPDEAQAPCKRSCSAEFAHCIRQVGTTEVAEAASILLTPVVRS